MINKSPPEALINNQPQRDKHPSAKVWVLTDSTGITGEEFDHTNIFLSANIVHATSQVVNNPRNMKEALAHPDSKKWKLSVVEEITRLQAIKSWSYVYPPIYANLIDTRFVFNLKGNEHGNPFQYCARLVAQGYKQVKEIDFNFHDIFAPVTRLKSVCAICTMAAAKDDGFIQTNIKFAFLYGCMEDVYLVPPKCIRLPGIQPGQVLKLHVCLYGLKQARIR